MKLKKGDEVKIVAGKDKGKTGKIEQIVPQKDQVVVTGVNQYKRHVKAKSGRQTSEIVTLTKPLPVANVMLICPKCKKTTRIGYALRGDKKTRICKKCEQSL